MGVGGSGLDSATCGSGTGTTGSDCVDEWDCDSFLDDRPRLNSGEGIKASARTC